MKVSNINNSSPRFCGYSNIITRQVCDKMTSARSVYMSMKLNNNGVRDLEAWHNIQRNVLKRDEPKDIITMFYVDWRNSDASLLWLGDKNLAEGMHKILMYFGLHENLLRACSFLYGLTSRIMNDNSWLSRDTETMLQVTKQAKEDLTPIFEKFAPQHGEEAAIDLITTSFYKEDKPQENAGIIGNNIYKFILPFALNEENSEYLKYTV